MCGLAVSSADSSGIDLLDLGDDPYPHYRTHRETRPVHWSSAAQAWYVMRYDDALGLLAHPRVCHWSVADDSDGAGYLSRTVARWLTAMDPRSGARLRRLTADVFAPAAAEAVGGRLRAIAEQAFDDARNRGYLDVVAHLAGPITLAAMAEILGVPPARVREFECATNGVAGSLLQLVEAHGLPCSERGSELTAFLANLLADTRPVPVPSLLYAMRQMRDTDPAVDEDELVAFLLLFLFAGQENMTNFIGNAIHALVRAPEELERLRQAPALIPSAVEELLRYDSPVQFMMVRVDGDVVVQGTTIPRRQPVLVGIGSANRDGARFVDPDRLDLTRSPNPHLSFGHGVLKCVGATLARLEASVAVGLLARRWQRPSILAHRRRATTPVLRGFESLVLAAED
jgi:cytochrome P450